MGGLQGDRDLERLVEVIAERVRARLGDAAPSLPVLPKDIPCEDDSQEDCSSCGLCVVRRPWSVRAIEDAGASRVAAPPGSAPLAAEMAKLIDHTLLKPE